MAVALKSIYRGISPSPIDERLRVYDVNDLWNPDFWGTEIQNGKNGTPYDGMIVTVIDINKEYSLYIYCANSEAPNVKPKNYTNRHNWHKIYSIPIENYTSSIELKSYGDVPRANELGDSPIKIEVNTEDGYDLRISNIGEWDMSWTLNDKSYMVESENSLDIKDLTLGQKYTLTHGTSYPVSFEIVVGNEQHSTKWPELKSDKSYIRCLNKNAEQWANMGVYINVDGELYLKYEEDRQCEWGYNQYPVASFTGTGEFKQIELDRGSLPVNSEFIITIYDGTNSKFTQPVELACYFVEGSEAEWRTN